METNEINQASTAGENPDNSASHPNALAGGHVAPANEPEESGAERIASQAKRAEQPEAGAATPDTAPEAGDLVRNTGDDADPSRPDADAATG